jgi:phosphatidate cytidylyltransferase
MKTRTISALVAVALFVAIFVIWREQGLAIISVLVGVGCLYEYSRLLFIRLDTPKHLRYAFMLFGTIILLATTQSDAIALPVFAIVSVFYFVMALLSVGKPTDLPLVLQVVCSAAVGFIYCGIFPGLVVRLIQMPSGTLWLFGLLAIVFSGDTFAYLTGRMFGKTKLLEAVSPKKTVEGSIGGLFGSAIVGGILGFVFLPTVPLGWLVMTALATGGFAQVGDLFESMIKRVAEVKDSGSIMPGHGGLLDRVDGVIFAAPIYYALVKFLSS